MEVLSPRSTNMPMKHATMKKPRKESKPKADDKPTNPDKIDEKWLPPPAVTEPGSSPETYITGRKLGKGGFAVCFEGTTKSRSEIFALKVVKAKVEQKKMMEKFRTELQIHAKMRHPNIVEFFRAFTVDKHTYVVLEMCPNGSLTDMVKSRSCLSLPEVRRFMIQICGGVKYIHKRCVIHRDLKMGNIFLDAHMNIKIGDFGLAAVMADEQDRRTTLCGTPNYIAPEILSRSGSRGHDNKVDTWAVGVICYAMLMGTPPFQSKTQQEIYSKLRTLEYQWTIDSKNYIPQQAKDFVASCLNLVAADRPEMDDLVEHDFFTMGAIADVLDLACLKAKPVWLENTDPRGDKVRRGYGVSHDQICNECGVGWTSEGRPRPAVGQRVNVSTLLEIEAENRQDCAPTVPLPEGTLYQQLSESRDPRSTHQKHPLAAGTSRSRKLVAERAEAQILARKIGAIDLEPSSSATNMIGHKISTARPIQSFAALQRQQALPAGAVSQRRRPQDDHTDAKVPAPAQGLLRERPMRAASVRTMRNPTSREAALSSTTTRPPSTTVLLRPENAEGNAPTAHGDNMTLRRIASVGGPAQRPTNLSKQWPQVYTEEIAPVGMRSSASTSSDDISWRMLRATTANDRLPLSAAHTQRSRVKQPEGPKAQSSSSSLPRLMSPKHHQPRIIAESDPYTTLEHTSSVDVLRCLRELYRSLRPRAADDQSTRPCSAYDGRRRPRSRSQYPRVDKWVDYTTRHGIAYILSDGTLGMILKSSEDNVKPSSCVVLRGARNHTIRRAKGLESQFVPQGESARPVEFYEQSQYSEDMKRLDVPAKEFLLDLNNYESELVAANAIQAACGGSQAERMKEVGLLDKFGKYMNKHTGDSDAVEDESEIDIKGSGYFIHFYQRLGNVGVWRFADGGLQFNFPDHTKLTIYSAKTDDGEVETMVDLVYLVPRDAKDLAARGQLTSEALERRGLMTVGLQDILDVVLRRSEMEIVKTNQVREKLSWVRAVIGCWLKEGGVGRMGEEKLGWSGLQERRDDRGTKLQWVTVGRFGGDGDGSPEA